MFHFLAEEIDSGQSSMTASYRSASPNSDIENVSVTNFGQLLIGPHLQPPANFGILWLLLLICL